MDADILSCPIYDKYLNEMNLKMYYPTSDTERLKIMTEFAEKFTLLPTLLLEVARLQGEEFKLDKYSTLYYINYGDKHIEWSDLDFINSLLRDFNCTNRFEIAEEVLSFPHQYLDLAYNSRTFYSVAPMSKSLTRTYEKSKKIYDQIKECENDIDKWLDCIKLIENKEAVIANMELAIGLALNWKNKNLWKFYFNFLKENNMIEILDVYRKYTRLFVSDKQAVEDYRNELDKFSSWNFPTTKYWIDTIKYEIDFGTILSAYRILERALKAVIGKPYHFFVKNINDLYKKLKIFGKVMTKIEQLRNSTKIPIKQLEEKSVSSIAYSKIPKPQYLCFHRSFIQNLLKNAKIDVLKKLYSTCKFFFCLRKAPLCYRFEISCKIETSYCAESLFINEKDVDHLKNLQIYEKFVVNYSTNPKLVSRILPNFKYFGARYIYLTSQDLTLSEFKIFLTKRLVQISFRDVEIKFAGKSIDVKAFFDIFKTVAKPKYIEYVNVSHIICRGNTTIDLVKNWLLYAENYEFKEIFFENQIFNVLDLQKFINYEMLQSITLKNATVKDENGAELNKPQIEEFIKAEVNPINNVCIEIF